MELSGYKNGLTYSAIQNVFNSYDITSIQFRRALLEVVYTCYPSEFIKEMKAILSKTEHPKLFAMAANYLIRNNELSVKEINRFLENKFKGWNNDPILFSLYIQINNKKENLELNELFSIEAMNNSNVIYCIQRKNRDFEGIIVIRGKDGQFIKDKKTNNTFYVPALARSVTNMPSYLTNGNSPQGIYSVLGLGSSNNVFIGPTLTLELGMPNEYPTSKYFHEDSLKSEWDIKKYKELLPKDVNKFNSLFEAYYAGLAGRTEIIVHGSTINPEYYKSAKYYPNTPSLGCITLEEEWSKETGLRIKSNQQRFINKLKSLDLRNTFFVLYEIDNKESDVMMSDILDDIQNAEAQLIK